METAVVKRATGAVTALEAVIGPVLQSLDSPHSRTAYRRALVEFIAWWKAGGAASSGDGTLDRAAIMTWRREMADGGQWAPATVNQKLAAVKSMVRELAARGAISWEAAGAVASVKGIKGGGVRTGNWLSRVEVEKLLAAPDMGTLAGIRDAAILRLILSGGLRRDDAARLVGGDLQLIAGRWALVDIVGKGGRVGTIPIASWAAAAVHEWQSRRGGMMAQAWEAGTGGNVMTLPIFTAVPRGAAVTPNQFKTPEHTRALTDKSIANVVKRYGGMIGRPDLAAHDLRRTFAQHAEQNGAPVSQVQKSLRHASLETTTRYLGGGQDMNRAPCDYLEFDMPAVPGGKREGEGEGANRG